jgi:cytochrome c oxidase subunit 2
VQCHSIDGTRKTGPSFKGIWGVSHPVLEDGQVKDVVTDDNYVIESIYYPQKKVVVSYGPPSAMPSFKGQLSQNEVQALIEFIKSLK